MRCGGYGPRQMNSPLDWCWPLCTSQRCCCSDTSLLHSNVWSEEKGTIGSDHHSAQLPRHSLHTLTPTSTGQNQTWHLTHTRLSQLSMGWEERKLWSGGQTYCRWLWGVWVIDRTRQFTCYFTVRFIIYWWSHPHFRLLIVIECSLPSNFFNFILRICPPLKKHRPSVHESHNKKYILLSPVWHQSMTFCGLLIVTMLY